MRFLRTRSRPVSDIAWSRHYRLTENELHQLATYNGERWRGLLHDPDWTARMAVLQDRFNDTGSPDEDDGLDPIATSR